MLLFFTAVSKFKGIFVTAEEDDDEDTAELLAKLIEGMTGIEPLMDYTLEECKNWSYTEYSDCELRDAVIIDGEYYVNW